MDYRIEYSDVVGDAVSSWIDIQAPDLTAVKKKVLEQPGYGGCTICIYDDSGNMLSRRRGFLTFSGNFDYAKWDDQTSSRRVT